MKESTIACRSTGRQTERRLERWTWLRRTNA